VAWFPSVPNIVREQNFGASYGSATSRSSSMPGASFSPRVLSSTGIAALDAEALTAARLSRYAVERSSCAAQGGTYAFAVDFDG
jgi:hypothetical protein